MTLVLSLTTPTYASKGDTWLSLRVGRSVPIGEFRKAAEPGSAWGGSATYYEAEHVGVGVDVMTQTWTASDASLTPYEWLFGSGMTSESHSLQLSGHVLVELPGESRLRPFLKGVISTHLVQATLNSPTFGRLRLDRVTRFGLGVGTGAHVNVLEGFDLGGFAEFHFIEDEGPNSTFALFGVSLVHRFAR